MRLYVAVSVRDRILFKNLRGMKNCHQFLQTVILLEQKEQFFWGPIGMTPIGSQSCSNQQYFGFVHRKYQDSLGAPPFMPLGVFGCSGVYFPDLLC